MAACVNNRILDAALEYLRRGYCPVAVPPAQKGPNTAHWPEQAQQVTAENAHRYFQPENNIGLLLGHGGLFDVDCDWPTAVTAARLVLPPTGFVFGRSSKPASHYFYIAAGTLPVNAKYVDPTDGETIVEFRSVKKDGGLGLQTVVPPSTHRDTSEAVRLEVGANGVPATVDAEAVYALVAQIAGAGLLARHWPDANRHACCMALAGALANGGMSEDDALQFVLLCHQSVPDHNPNALAEVEHTVRDTYHKHEVDAEHTAFRTLGEMVGKEVAARALAWLGLSAPTNKNNDVLVADLHQIGLSAQFLIACGGDLQFVDEFKKWLVWDGRRWQPDNAGAAECAKEYVAARHKAAVAKRDKAAAQFLRGAATDAGITGLLSLASKSPAVRVTADTLDTNIHSVVVQNGVLDLRTGALSEHDRMLRATKMLHYDYDPTAQCPVWLAFLRRITGGHVDPARADRLTAYLQLAFGYSLTGDVSQKSIFVPFGASDTGKTTMLTAFFEIVSEFGVLINPETIMAKGTSDNNRQADLARLHGARFAMTSETEEGQQIHPSKLKRICQGQGLIHACRKYEAPFSFPETHKLWMDTNYRPVIPSDDQATFNRLKPIPFEYPVPKAEQDRELPAKLRDESAGILAWAVAGSVQRYSVGLPSPPEVTLANEQWQGESDQIKEFISERCETVTGTKIKASALYMAYRGWMQDRGEEPLTMTAFGKRVPFQSTHLRDGNYYLGVRLREW